MQDVATQAATSRAELANIAGAAATGMDDGIRSLTLLNMSGDSTLVWGPANDELMRGVIEKKLAEGVVFHVLKERFPGTALGQLLGDRKVRVRNVEQAMASRKLSMADADFAAIITDGGVQMIRTPERPGGVLAGGSRVSKDPDEIMRSQSVGIRQYHGG